MSLHGFINSHLPLALRPVTLASARYLRTSGYVVKSGPFRGMRYIQRAYTSALLPKIAGVYEQELHPFLPLLFTDRPDVFVDVGAAEGYYAVGAVFAGWADRIVAFEGEPAAQAACRSLMALNDVTSSQVELRGLCTAADLQALLAEARHPAMIMDVDGYEAFLLEPLRVPALAHCRILLEHHDFMLPGLCDEIIRRMTPTHEITPISQSRRHAADFISDDPLLRRLPDSIRWRALMDNRPHDRHGWLWMTPRHTA